jgi:hypothetical protein
MSNYQSFKHCVEATVDAFEGNEIFRLLRRGEMNVRRYHRLLVTLLPQVRESASSFALAGVNCPVEYQEVKYYLISHAEEEQRHWEWIIGDLRGTGFQSDPSAEYVLPFCEAYIAYNYFVAFRFPVGRLATASVLEGIGARYGAEYGKRLCQSLHLAPTQMSFFLSHGETDVKHVEDLEVVLQNANLSPHDWSRMGRIASTAGRFYRGMYDEAAECYD